MKMFLILIILATVFVVGIISFGLSGKQTAGKPITVYKSQSCGCCDQYITYLNGRGFQVTVVNTENMDSIKSKYGIPLNMQSCHTSSIGNYFIEGHIPVEAVNKLLEENPDIKGIAMPGMPAGSPGMGGIKSSPFIVYSVSESGTTEFARV